MRVNVYATHNSVEEKDIKDKLVVVVDVLRATSTIITSIDNGCKEVIPVVDIEEAMEMSRNYERETCFLAGERNALMIEGFDLSNSPAEYTKDVVEDKSIIFTTTNGTKAIRRAEGAKQVVLGALINAKAVSDYILSFREDVAFICAGTEGRFSLDDIVAVGAIISRMDDGKTPLDFDDLALVCRYIYRQHSHDLDSIMQKAKHYNVLKETKYYKDIEYCLREDIISIVPEYVDGIIRIGEDNF